ncbi:MAG: preprotein translocase subunit SecD, partial [Candidatus Altiarchaeales archaeon]
REPFIVLPIIITCLSEIIIILGVASFINWELDLPAVAGIIAAVGTGVDDQIVITDETMEREKRKKKIISLTERIRRAFFIIFTAAATTIAVMLPIFSIQALKGFAFTTVIGVVIGVFVTRPAYAKIIEEVLRE